MIGDLIGPNRGAVLPSAVAGYLGMCGCGLLPVLSVGLFVGAFFALLVLFPALITGALGTSWLGIIGLAYPALFLAFPAAHCGTPQPLRSLTIS